MHIEDDKAFKMKAHHVPLRQIVPEIRLEKDQEEEFFDENKMRGSDGERAKLWLKKLSLHSNFGFLNAAPTVRGERVIAHD